MAENTTIKLSEDCKRRLDNYKDFLKGELKISSLSYSDVVSYLLGERGED